MSANENMQRVAQHLQRAAIGVADDEKDAFARSAYNRYYYGIFLSTRDMFRQMNSDWSQLAHANYPEILSGKVERAFRNEWTKARRRGDIELIKGIEQAIRSIAELKKIIIKANSTRVVADYKPEQAVDFQSAGRFSLSNVEITEAHGWAARVAILCASMLKTWRQFNV